MECKEFEVGKFYSVRLYPTYGTPSRGCPAMVIRKTKTKIVFSYLRRDFEGRLRKGTVERRLVHADKTGRGIEEAWSRGKWDAIPPTNASEVRAKPQAWDEVKAE